MKEMLCRLLPKQVIDMLVIYRNRIKVLLAYLRYFCGNIIGLKIKNYYNVPIIINNFNRLGYLKRLISSLEVRGYSNIYIIDNGSTFPPLLNYYMQCKYPVFLLNKNAGHKAIWETGIYEQFKRDYYVYTDSDMEIDESCPNDFMERFVNFLKKYPTAQKVGFGIRIDDLPESYSSKEKVIEWEIQFWNKEVEPGLFRAEIDTTFALYRPYCQGESDYRQKVFRTGFPYVIRHLPWYNLSEFKVEDDYYLSQIKSSTHWSVSNRDNK